VSVLGRVGAEAVITPVVAFLLGTVVTM